MFIFQKRKHPLPFLLVQATTWVKRESEEKYHADVASGRTLGGGRKGLPQWGAALGNRGLGSFTDGSPGQWFPKWMAKPASEPAPESVAVVEVRRMSSP